MMQTLPNDARRRPAPQMLWSSITASRYGVALGAVLIAWLLVTGVSLLQQLPYVTFLVAVIVASWAGGLGPGIVATLAAAMVLINASAPAQVIVFSLMGLLTTVLNDRRVRAEVLEQHERDRFRASLGAATRDLEIERARFEAVLQQMPGGVAIVSAPSGALVLQNQRAADLIGLMPEGTLASSAQDLEKQFRKVPALATWPLMRALQTGEVVHNETFELVNRKGERMVLSASAAPIRDTAGATIAAVTTFEDVTELKAAEESLRFLQEASTTLAASLDFEATLRSVVQLAVPRLADWCLLHTATEDSHPPRMTASHVMPEKLALLEMLYAEYPVPAEAPHGYTRVIRTGEPELVPDVPADWVKQAHDERHREYLRQLELRSLICLPLRVAGRTVGALTLAMGESERRFGTAEVRLAEHFARRVSVAVDNARLYRESSEEDRRKSEFLALMAHELRNPLAPMRNAVEILRLTEEPETAERMRNLLDRQLGHMARLIGDLVDVSRIERNLITLRLAPVDAVAVVRRAIDVHRAAIEAREQSLVELMPAAAPLVRADPARFEQIVSNLIDNAVKYTAARGTIEVRVEPLDQRVAVAVRDSGSGIKADFLPHVFDSFRRGHQPGTTASGGLGIGLTLVKHLVDLHGGTVTARSAGAGQGSEFVVTLPVDSSAAGEAGPAAPVTAVSPERRLRALVCDDNARAADTLGTLLELWGYDVSVVYDGESAVAAANTQWPDVALLDLTLPGISGHEVADRLRRLPAAAKLFLVAISGHGQEDDRRRSREAGFDHHLVKPIDPPALESLLRTHAQETVKAS